MDSDSRMPFFGLQLGSKEKKPSSDVVSAGRSGTSESKAVPASLREAEESPRRGKLSQWFGGLGKPKRIPLPITDSHSEGDSPETVGANVNGLAGF